MDSLHALCEELAVIQAALANDVLERLPPLVETYHAHLHAWMATGIHKTDQSIEPLRQLRDLHHQVIAGMQQCQQRLHARMQAERHGSRVARAYLSGA